MKRNRLVHFVAVACTIVGVVVLFSGRASAASRESALYNFTGGNDGGNAASSVIFDGSGNAYGTTVVGGTSNCGTVFELRPRAHHRWAESVLYNFSCFADGKNPHGGVTFDAAGNLYGTTVAGGSGGICAGDGCGVIYELTPSGERVLYNFTGGNDGFGPGNAVVFDRAGNLYGMTPDGGAYSSGTVYQLTPQGSGWQENVIHTFTGGNDGAVGSLGPLLLDAAGQLYGVTELGGAHEAGTAFKLSSEPAGKWNLRTLYAFQGQPDAAFPYGGLISDKSGNFYGTTYYGGTQGVGTVFELSPKARGPWAERKLYDFKGGTDASSPTGTLVFDASGNLFGTSSAGGRPSCDCGTVFKLASNTRTERVVHRFGLALDGAYPYYGLTLGPAGNLYSTTVAGGLNNQGTVFELTP
ncbi:MAG: choice-of-anchor tandem repeat GloVer-containing protein [Candidatus Baltobacteraceae bacterium]